MIKVNFAVRNNQIYNSLARQIIIPTVDGEITILSGHIPLITVIKSGELVITDEHGKHFKYAVVRGAVIVERTNENPTPTPSSPTLLQDLEKGATQNTRDNNTNKMVDTTVTLICDDAIESEKIDIAIEQEAVARAEEVIKNGETYEDIGGLTSPLERELNRIRVAKRR